MRITASTVQLSAARVEYASTSRTEAMKAWVGDEPADPPGATPARPALAAIAGPPPVLGAKAPAVPATLPDATAPAAAGEAAAGEDDAQQHDLDLLILRRTFRLERRLSRAAREVRDAYADPRPGEDAARLAASAAPAATAQAAPPPPPREGWGLRYDLSERTVRTEAVSFAAAAHGTTADGRTIDVQAALAMSRTEVTSREVHLRAGDAARVDPLALNLAGGPATLAGTTAFDLDADGAPEQVAALGPGSAWLAVDRDGNGTIDSGAELFGPTTGSGFGELAALDGDGNGWVDEGDAAFAGLRLWSPGGALTTLQAAGVGAIYTGAAATPFELRDGGAAVGAVAETGLFLREDGTAGTVQHVDLVA